MEVNRAEEWAFRLHCRDAQKVYLVIEDEAGATQTLPMESLGHHDWELRLTLAEGGYSFRYFVSDGRSLMNFGDHGLRVHRPASEHVRAHARRLAMAKPNIRRNRSDLGEAFDGGFLVNR